MSLSRSKIHNMILFILLNHCPQRLKLNNFITNMETSSDTTVTTNKYE